MPECKNRALQHFVLSHPISCAIKFPCLCGQNCRSINVTASSYASLLCIKPVLLYPSSFAVQKDVFQHAPRRRVVSKSKCKFLCVSRVQCVCVCQPRTCVCAMCVCVHVCVPRTCVCAYNVCVCVCQLRTMCVCQPRTCRTEQCVPVAMAVCGRVSYLDGTLMLYEGLEAAIG
jgi:hypothetical protein